LGGVRGFSAESGVSRSLKIKGIKDIIAVASGKGGVGKSTTAVNLAVSLANKCQLNVGLLDADVFGPSVPTMMKLHGKPEVSEGKKMIPIENYGVKCISMGSLVGKDEAIVWRGPMVMKALEQMSRGVDWGELDILVVDMPPGTGDAQISISQRLQLSGALIVSTPQDVALIDARRGVKMFTRVSVPILGILENMSYFKCPHCGEPYFIFGKGGARKTAEDMGLRFLGEIPLEEGLRIGCDEGLPIVVSKPDSSVSKAYCEVAQQVVSRIQELANDRELRPEITFSNTKGSKGVQVLRTSSGGGAAKEYDVATLGNLCVDVVLNVPDLPPPSRQERKAYMDELSKSPPDKQNWEAGGNCNMAIAAARLGLRCITIGHVGDEIYGRFLLDVLHDEGIGVVGMSNENHVDSSSSAYETLLCWVLVDPMQRHDFSKEPAFNWMSKLSTEVKMAIKKSKILFCNGYGFDELPPGLIISAIEHAVEVGTSIFFDPGPRGKTLAAGRPEEQRALDMFLRLSDVLLLTSEEAESLTSIGNPILAGQELLNKGTRTKWVIVKMGSKGSILITKSSISCVPAFKVNVIDTVGCGDSFVAAIAFGYIHNIPLVNTLALANGVGAATAMGCGAGRNVATLEQVMEIMRGSNLNEDDKFLNEHLDVILDDQEMTFLSKMDINGSSSRLNRVSLQKVVSEVLPKLESPRVKGRVPS
ncbi:hypothetical protein RJ639_031469, partial [Escallonia herrerae]